MHSFVFYLTAASLLLALGSSCYPDTRVPIAPTAALKLVQDEKRKGGGEACSITAKKECYNIIVN